MNEFPKTVRYDERRCYVYAYYVDNELWIIGKGSGNADQRHLRLAHAYNAGTRTPDHMLAWQIELADAIKAGSDVRVTRLADTLTN